MKPSYCTQNNGNCDTCSLVNYGRDCRNNNWGGKRPGSGRKLIGTDKPRKSYSFKLSEAEHAKVKEYIQNIKEEKTMTTYKFELVNLDGCLMDTTEETSWDKARKYFAAKYTGEYRLIRVSEDDAQEKRVNLK